MQITNIGDDQEAMGHRVVCMGRKLTRVVAALVGVLSLSGCIKMDMDMKVRADDKLDGTVVIAFSTQLLQATGQTKKQILDSMKSDSTTSVKGAKTSTYDQDGWIGQKITFEGVPASEFAKATGVAAGAAAATGQKASGDDFKLVKVGANWQFNGTMDLASSTTGGKGTTPDLSKLGDGLKPQIRIKLTFPGKITKHDKDGKVSGNSITWSPALGKKIVMAATAAAG